MRTVGPGDLVVLIRNPNFQLSAAPQLMTRTPAWQYSNEDVTGTMEIDAVGFVIATCEMTDHPKNQQDGDVRQEAYLITGDQAGWCMSDRLRIIRGTQ